MTSRLLPSPRPVACLICRAAAEPWAVARDREYCTTDQTYDYFHCPNCQGLSIDPVPVDQLGTIYPANYYSYGGADSAVARIKEKLDQRRFSGILASLKGSELAALDIGGGSGWLLSTLRKLDPRVKTTQVVDLDKGAEQRAIAAGHGFFCGPIEQYEPDRPYDLVLLLNLIEHVQDPNAVLAKVAGCLAPGGVALVKTPNVDAWDARLFRHRNWAGYHAPRHWALFTRAGFEAAAQRAGLVVKQFSYTQGAPFWAASTLFALADKGWVRIDRDRPVVYHPLFGLLAAAFAGLDLLRAPFAKPSQMFFLLEKKAGAV